MTSVFTLAVRNNNGWEVLLGLKNVIDFRRTLRASDSALHLCRNPGEYVIPGGEVRPGESAGRAALRTFCEAVQLKVPRRAVMERFHSTGDDALFWLLRADDNRWMSLVDDEELREKNRYFIERDAAVSIDTDTGRLVSSWSWEYYGELHLLFWLPVDEALGKFNRNDPPSQWQEDQNAVARQAMRAYDNYNLIQVYNNERMFPARDESALQHLVQNPMVTNIQVYRDRHRKHPVLLGGSGQIIYSHSMTYIKGEKFTVIAEPVLGHPYFVVAYNGPEIVLFQTMSYVGKSQGLHKFSASTFAGSDEPDGPPAHGGAEMDGVDSGGRDDR